MEIVRVCGTLYKAELRECGLWKQLRGWRRYPDSGQLSVEMIFQKKSGSATVLILRLYLILHWLPSKVTVQPPNSKRIKGLKYGEQGHYREAHVRRV